MEFTVPRSKRGIDLPFSVHTTDMIKPIDFVEVAGFRATSATRTIIDLAHARAHPRRIEAAIDSAVRLGLSSPEVISKRVETLRGSGRWGCRLIDDLVVDAGGHTMLERRFLQLVREAGLPRPRTQVVHRKNGRHVARVDFLFDEANVVVEVSGQLGHSTPFDRGRDAQRRNELQDIGRRVYEYTWEDVTKRPAYVRSTLIQRLRIAPDAHRCRIHVCVAKNVLRSAQTATQTRMEARQMALWRRSSWAMGHSGEIAGGPIGTRP